MIPQKIDSFLVYTELQDQLWTAYDNARKSLPKDNDCVQDPQVLSCMSRTYDKLMRHLEAAYYKNSRKGRLLSPKEIDELLPKSGMLSDRPSR